MSRKTLEGKVALITGSSRGIGLASAREMARRGASVVLNARGEERLEKAHAELVEAGFNAAAIPCDVSDPDACKAMVDFAVDEFGRLDIILNNAGVSMRSELAELDAETCRNVVDVNMLGCIYPTLYAVPHIKETKGHVLFISSIAGIIGLPTASLYCATKTGLVGFANSIRCELAPAGVHVGVIYVGFTENDPEKKVLGAGGETISPDRPAHMTQAQVAGEICRVIEKRRRGAVLSPIGKFAKFAAWFSEDLVEQIIIFTRKHNLSEKLNIR